MKRNPKWRKKEREREKRKCVLIVRKEIEIRERVDELLCERVRIGCAFVCHHTRVCVNGAHRGRRQRAGEEQNLKQTDIQTDIHTEREREKVKERKKERKRGREKKREKEK